MKLSKYIPSSISHLSPTNPGGHLHINSCGESLYEKQVPLLLHGGILENSLNESQAERDKNKCDFLTWVLHKM